MRYSAAVRVVREMASDRPSQEAISRPSPRGRRTPRSLVASWWGAPALALAVSGAMSAAAVALLTLTPLKDDVAWLLYAADQTLRGHRLYVDIVEINPPLIVLLSMAPVRLAPVLGISAAAVYTLSVSAALVAVAILVGRILERSARAMNRSGFVIAAMIGAFFLLPGRDFGQRDHLVVALLAPWLALVSVRASGTTPSRGVMLIVGLLAALALGLKPHYVLVLLVVEGWALTQGIRWRRSEVAVTAVGLALYGIFVIWWFPEYFTEALPLAWGHYDAGDISLMRLLLNAREVLPCLGIVLLLAACRRRWLERPIIVVLLLASVAAMALYFLQFKGWAYHRIGADILLLLLCLSWLNHAMVDDSVSPSRAARWAVLGTALSVGLLCALTIERQRVVVDRAWHAGNSAESWLTSLVQRTEAKSLMAFSDRLEPFFPVVNDTGISWTSRYASMWALKGALHQRMATRARGWTGNSDVLANVVDDFVNAQPALVVIDDATQFDYLEMLIESSRFREAWAHYHQIDSFQGLRAFLRHRVGSARKPGGAQAFLPG